MAKLNRVPQISRFWCISPIFKHLKADYQFKKGLIHCTKCSTHKRQSMKKRLCRGLHLFHFPTWKVASFICAVLHFNLQTDGLLERWYEADAGRFWPTFDPQTHHKARITMMNHQRFGSVRLRIHLASIVRRRYVPDAKWRVKNSKSPRRLDWMGFSGATHPLCSHMGVVFWKRELPGPSFSAAPECPLRKSPRLQQVFEKWTGLFPAWWVNKSKMIEFMIVGTYLFRSIS